MNLRRTAAARPSTYPRNEELVQRRHELTRSIDAARTLAELLELADRRDDYVLVRDLHRRLWADLAALDERSADER